MPWPDNYTSLIIRIGTERGTLWILAMSLAIPPVLEVGLRKRICSGHTSSPWPINNWLRRPDGGCLHATFSGGINSRISTMWKILLSWNDVWIDDRNLSRKQYGHSLQDIPSCHVNVMTSSNVFLVVYVEMERVVVGVCFAFEVFRTPYSPPKLPLPKVAGNN